MRQDTVASASSLVESLNGELVDSHRRLVALMENMGTESGHSSGRDETNGFFPDKVFQLFLAPCLSCL